MQGIFIVTPEILSNSISITGFRYEICCKGTLSLQQAKDIFTSYLMSNGLPEGIEVAYKELIQFVYIEYEDIRKGRASSEPSVEKKADMARLLNCFGYFSTKFEKLLSRLQNEPHKKLNQQRLRMN